MLSLQYTMSNPRFNPRLLPNPRDFGKKNDIYISSSKPNMIDLGLNVLSFVPQVRVINGISKLHKVSKTMSFPKAKALFKEKLANDPKINSSIRGYLKNQYKQKGSWYKVKNPPGYDVGHRVRGVHNPKQFKLELSRDNRSRGAKIERGTNAYKPKPTVDKGSYLVVPGIQSVTANPFHVSGLPEDKNIDLSIDQYIKEKIELLCEIGTYLEPVLGSTFTSNIVSTLSNKCTSEELTKSVPRVVRYFESSKNIECFTSNTVTVDQILLDTSQRKQKVVTLNGAWLHNNRIHWGFAIKWKRKRWGWHVCLDQSILNIGGGGGAHETQLQEFCKNPHHIYEDMKNYFAGHCAIPVEYIAEIIPPPSGRGEGSLGAIGYRWRYVWQNYKFTVILHEGYDFDYSPITKVEEIEEPVIQEVLSSGTCVKCKKESFKHTWKDGSNLTLYFGLCEDCYTIFAKRLSNAPCEKCHEDEEYHLWKDGWTGQCYNGLCESCTTGVPKPAKIDGTVEEQIKIVENKLELARKHYQKVYQEYRSNYIACSGKQDPGADKQYKDLPWYPEHCKLWQIQSNAMGEVQKLEKKLEELMKDPIKLGKKLVIACKEGNLHNVKTFIEQGVDINFPHFSGINNGLTPLLMACQYGHHDIVSFLLDNGANVNQDFSQITPLMLTIASGESTYESRCEILKLLLQRGADIGPTDCNGWTASMYAEKHGYTKMVKIIEDNYVR